MNHNILNLNNKIIKCKQCPRLIKFRDKIVKTKRKQFLNENIGENLLLVLETLMQKCYL